MNKKVMMLAGAGQIGMAIARRTGYGMKIIIGDRNIANATTVADVMNKAGFDAEAVEMDLSNRESIRNFIAEAQKHGEIEMLVNAAGVSPSQASIETILKVDLLRHSRSARGDRAHHSSRRYRRDDFESVGTPYGGTHA